MIAGLLLVLAALVHLGTEYAPGLWGGTHGAWHYVAYGFEALCLWLFVAHMASQTAWRWPVWAVCSFGVWESVQRAGCRLMLPMDRAPQLADGQSICQAAGVPGWLLTPAVLALVAAAVAQRTCKG